MFAAAACWLLLALYGDGNEASKTRLEGVRTVGTVVLGAGGAVALLLTARRQQTAEHDLATKRHDLILREEANADLRHDAAERRITELYLKAVEQLGADKATVRLAGLYALDRLAQDNSAQRQTIVNVISAYLRMPYELPSSAPGAEEPPEARRDRWEKLQEREVRVTAQRILTEHLDPALRDAGRFWEDIDLDLSGALLIDFTLRDCRVNNARFTDATFAGETRLLGIEFTGETWFERATFTDDAWFCQAAFQGITRFDQATFASNARFDGTAFTGASVFRDATFLGESNFDDSVFRGRVVFARANFARTASFRRTSFLDDAYLPAVTFNRDTYFLGSRFAKDAWFSQVFFNGNTSFEDATFSGDIRFTDATLDGSPYWPSQLTPREADHFDNTAPD
ncbi:hypothetical protein A4R43_13015 [Amycolatopsis albispora]|uniref:Pentapeptide repeat-containing protein n=1 Tax=Amycolatopsis albispora TaxID=1804986 RepID=A0A344LK72_9PSEU|nr:hypothetical protein A4R43_13015 [Amycolatopsis albispora]